MNRPFSEGELLRNPQLAYDALGPEGPGALQVYPFVYGQTLDGMKAEMHNPEQISWYPSTDPVPNKRGLIVAQNFEVYALRIGAGDQQPLTEIPYTTNAAERTTRFVQRLAPALPTLKTWDPTELGLHKYYDLDLGIDWHRDNERFIGVIAILSVMGKSDLKVRKDESDTNIVSYKTYEGLLTLLRASRLIPEAPDLLCPDHTVVNLQTKGRISMQLRQNSRPDDPVEGFEFANWPLAA